VVDDPETSVKGDGDGHLSLGDGVHGGREEGAVEGDLLGDFGLEGDFRGGKIDLSGQDQEIVVGQSSLSVPPGVHQLSQRETVPGFVLFEGGQGLVGREEGGGHVGGRALQYGGLG